MKAMLMDATHLFARNLPLEESNEDPRQAAARALGLWFCVKSSSWSYELEWRCLKWKPGPQAFPAQAITRLILGCVNTETNLRLVRAALKRKNLEIPLHKAVRKRGEFGLDIVPAES